MALEPAFPKKKNLSTQVAEHLFMQIISGHYAEGSTLPSEESLCTQFSVSRTAVREAIKILLSKGFVMSRPKTGTKILPRSNWNFLDKDVLEWSMRHNPESISKDFQKLRSCIEPEICAAAAINISASDRKRLADAFQEMKNVSENWEHDKWVESDVQFHNIITKASSNIFFIAFGELIKDFLMVNIQAASSNESTCLDEHKKVMDAILMGDANKAKVASLDLLVKK